MNKVLVYRIGSIGDTLVALPAFWAIRKAFPSARITYLSNGETDSSDDLIARKILPKGLFDDWTAYPSKNLIKAAPRLIRHLRKQNFDALFYLMPRTRSALRVKRDLLFFRAAGLKKVFGAKYLASSLLSLNPGRPVAPVEREADFLLDCLYSENLNWPAKENLTADLQLTNEEIQKAREWLQANCASAWRENRLLAVMTGSNWSSKIWPEENYARVVSLLIKEKNVYPIIFGGPRERAQGDRLIAAWQTGANAAGELGLRGDAALLRECRMYLGADTGTMHLAAAVGKPCAGVFAATDYDGRWTPFGHSHKIFRERVECEVCFAPKCFNQRKCLNLITPEAVFAGCAEILERDAKL